MTNCTTGTPPIEDQILTGTITQLATANDFGKIKMGNLKFAYFNYNNQYQELKLNDIIHFFFTDSDNVVIELSGNVINYPTGTNNIAFNLHQIKKTLQGKDGGPKGEKNGTGSTNPPSSLYSNLQGGAKANYFINDCGEVHLVKSNPNINDAWDRFKVKLVSTEHSPINLYEYDGSVSEIWIP